MVRYFKNPNLHDQKLNQAIAEGPGGLTVEEFTKRKCLYLTLTSLLKQEEIKYQEYSLVDGFEAYAKEEWPFSQPYPVRRFGGISYALVPGPTQFYYKFAEIQDPEISSVLGYSSCIYHKPKVFRSQHLATEHLTLDGCHGISSRRVPSRVHSSFHLHWISEYANACSSCQHKADGEVIDFYRRGLINHHRPRYHPVFFPYEGRQHVEARHVWRLKFVTHGEEISEQDRLQLQLEPRPTRREFFLHIIERQHLWYNHTINLAEELTDYDPPTDVPVEPLEDRSPIVSVDESP